MKVIVFLSLCFLTLACNKEEPVSEWKVFDFGAFTLKAPSTWKEFTAQSYDSKIGGITNGRDTLNYDYGMFSYRFTNETPRTHIITEANRNGYPTKLVKPIKPGEGIIGIYYNLGVVRLTLFGRSSNENTFMKILESVEIE